MNSIENPNKLMPTTINMSMMSSIREYLKLIISTLGMFLLTGIVLAVWLVVKSDATGYLIMSRVIIILMATGLSAMAAHG
ncbi:hypothetical protein WJU16_20420 [Chitinophaga pollutisoli]|uniref:BAX inhibitor (BI)-1/YccA family protein n=1 Tax=Chitinophaga pollutisoli TaxID=3133966 RepID=A0ABZ2YKX8_9BACT